MSTHSIVGAIPEVYYRRVWQAVQWSWLKIEAINFVLTKWPVSSSNPISSIIKWGEKIHFLMASPAPIQSTKHL